MFLGDPSVGMMGGTFFANAVDYNGSTDYLSRSSAFVGGANNSQGIFSSWFRLDGGDGTSLFFFGADVGAGANSTLIRRNSSNGISIALQNAGPTAIFQFATAASYITSATWHHLLISWDTGFGSGSRFSNLYIDNVSDNILGTDTGSSFTNNFSTETNLNVAADGGSSLFNGCLAEVYLASGQYLDFSILSNRQKFILNGKPVSLGSTGSTPTGIAPTIYLPNMAATIGTNAGTGGDFTINGSPANASTSPSS